MTDLSRILTSRPVNRTAGLVTSDGISFDDSKKRKEWTAHWEAPPKVLPPDKHPRSSGFENLTGRTFGRMVVIGLLPPEFTKNGAASWLVRCSCGDYEVRKSKAIKTITDPDHACVECSYNLALSRGLLGDGK